MDRLVGGGEKEQLFLLVNEGKAEPRSSGAQGREPLRFIYEKQVLGKKARSLRAESEGAVFAFFVRVSCAENGSALAGDGDAAVGVGISPAEGSESCPHSQKGVNA